MALFDVKLSDFDPTNSDAEYGKYVAAAGDVAVQAVGGPPGAVTGVAGAIEKANEVTDNTFTLNNIQQVLDAREGSSESSLSSVPNDGELLTEYNPETGATTQYQPDGDLVEYRADGDVSHFDSNTGDTTYHDVQTGEVSVYNLDGDIISYG